MKKVLLLMLLTLFIVGCSIKNTPRTKVDELFKKYQNLDEDVLSDLELTSESSMFTEEQKPAYISAIRRQYTDMTYEITDEKIDGDVAVVTVNLEVYDLYKAQKEAEDYLNRNALEFTNDNIFDNNKFLNFKIDKMSKIDERVNYTIVIDLTKKDGKWQVEKFSSDTLKKIHGTYNYEND